MKGKNIDMNKFKFLIQNKKDYFIIVSFFVVINFFLITKIKTPVIIPDEINTLAIPAWISGNKWNINTAYYGWGGSIVYSLLFLSIKNPITLYKGILLLNSFVLSIIPCIVLNMLKKFFDLKNRKLLITISILIGLYPGNFSMALYSWNEIWVRVIVWIILFILLYQIKNCNKNLKTNSILLGVFLAYGYSIHGRMLAMIPTVCIIYIIIYIKYKIKIFKIIFTLIGFFPIFIIDITVKKIINKIIFKGEVLGNTFSDVINKLVKFPNKKSVFSMIRAVFSYTYYLEIVSFGLLFLLIIILLKLLKENKKETINFEVLGLFTVLGMFFSTIISVLFFIEHLIKYNYYIYGRYTDQLVPFAIVFALIYQKKYNIGLKKIIKTIGFMLIYTILIFLIENNKTVEPVTMNVATLMAFTKGFIFETPEKFQIVILIIISLSIYILFTFKINLSFGIDFMILIYLILNMHLGYSRIESSKQVFSILKNKFEILELIRKNSNKKYELNFISEQGRYPLTYLMLLNNYNVVYDENQVKENIINKKNQINFVTNYKETLMLDKNIYKIEIFNNDINSYNLYYKGENITKILESKKVKSEQFNSYIIPSKKMFINNQTLLDNDNIISNNSTLYGPYIELRPNKYKLTISGEDLNDKKIALSLYAKKNENEKSSLINYSIISESKNLYIVEFTLESFVKDFEVVITNNSGKNIKLNLIRIDI